MMVVDDDRRYETLIAKYKSLPLKVKKKLYPQYIQLIENLAKIRSISLVRNVYFINLNNSIAPPPPPPEKKNKQLTVRQFQKRTYDVMNEWFNNHYSHPYPSRETREIIGKHAGITERQVDYWFINKRSRNWI